MRSVTSRLVVALCALVPLLVGGPLLAQTEAEVEQSRLKGVEFLKSEQLEDGSWEFEGHDVGITALCALALVENGVPVSDRMITRAQSFIREKAPEVTNTYDVALTIVLLSRLGDRDDRQLIREMAARLVAGQNEEGGWHYGCPKANVLVLTDPNEKPEPMKGVGDNSCTQFAVLGLWVASRWGVNIEAVMDQVAARFIDTQSEEGAWSYNYWDGKMGSPQAMTYAGLFCLTVAKATKIRQEQSGRPVKRTVADAEKPEPKGKKSAKDKAKDKEKDKEVAKAKPAAPANIDPALAGGGGLGGLGGLGGKGVPAAKPAEAQAREPNLQARAAFEKAAILKDDAVYSKGLTKAGEYAAGISPASAKYFLWSVERLGVILGLEQFGETNWFSQGAQGLIASQKEDGSWEGGWGNKSETAFAILFLRKANLGSDISRLLEGEPKQPFVISSRPEHPRFDTFADALKDAKAGETIRIDGSGPYDMPHLEFSEDLTIQAGPGYAPVFRYAIGNDADGKRSRPEADVNARHMVRVNSGTLTLEGLELRVDTPALKSVTDWSAAVVNGGNLRMLNCSVSEDKKNKMAAVRVLLPGKTELRNCQLVGGRAGVEIETNGEQTVSLDNCLVFSDKGITAMPSASPENASLTLTVNRTTVQAVDGFAFAKVTTPVNITVYGLALKGTWLGSSMLPDEKEYSNISWTGSNNIYDISKWVGAGGKAVAKIKDAKTFNEFFGGKDEKGNGRPLAFTGKKPIGAFSHTIRGEDFELAQNSTVYAYRLTTGIDPLVIGPGNGFLRFRDSFDYRDWQNGAAIKVASN